jgi:hypothetical protein
MPKSDLRFSLGVAFGSLDIVSPFFMARFPELRGSMMNDDDAPVRPRGAFMMYATERRLELRAAEPGLSFGELAEKMGLEWRALSQEARQPFEALAQAEKAVYEREKEAFEARGGIIRPRGGGRVAREDDDADDERY